MPRGALAPPPKPDEHPVNALISSAANLTRGDLRPKRTGAESWQTAAWAFYDVIGELRFAGNWMGNALSRVDVFPARETPDGMERIETGPAADAMAALFGGETGRSQMMATLGIHLTVAGESYIVGEPTDNGDQWLVLSTEEIQGRGNQWSIDRGDGRRHYLPADALIMRIWRPHPRRWIEADSSVRAVLPVLRELEQLTKHVGATIDSRLAGAGMLLLPSEMTFATPTPGIDPMAPESDPFLMALTEAMVAPIEDRGSPASVVPIVVRAPGAVLGSAQYISFATPFDSQALALRDEAIRRLALGLDMPPEVLLGQSDSNHWSAWQIDEDAMKVHIEPVCELIADALTKQYLHPAVEGSGDTDAIVMFDTSELRIRPDHSSQALQLYDRFELSAEALRRETGFDETDAPEDDEVHVLLAKRLASSSGDYQGAAVSYLGLDFSGNGGNGGGEPAAPPAAPPEPDNLRSLPERAEPGTEPGPTEQQVASLMASAELLAIRAIERAQARMGKRTGGRPEAIDGALHDAWVNVPRCAAQLGVNAESLEKRLDSYVRVVLMSGAQHTPELLRKILFETPEQVLAFSAHEG